MHNKIKWICKDCVGSQICEHGHIRHICISCKGGGICNHSRVKYACKDCGGHAYCEHNVLKIYCRQCGGGGLCAHNKRKHQCRECCGSIFCMHGKQKQYCKICGGSALCKSLECETTGNRKYDGFCFTCFISNPENQNIARVRNYKNKEKLVVSNVLQSFSDFTWIMDKRVPNGRSTYRPDMLVDLGFQILIIEIDEDMHRRYDAGREHERLMEISQDCTILSKDGTPIHKPTIFIRFNPDAYIRPDGTRVSSCWRLTQGVMGIMPTKYSEWEQRLDILNQTIAFWISNRIESDNEIVWLFYE